MFCRNQLRALQALCRKRSAGKCFIPVAINSHALFLKCCNLTPKRYLTNANGEIALESFAARIKGQRSFIHEAMHEQETRQSDLARVGLSSLEVKVKRQAQRHQQ
jgi:hypothetical protein